MDLPEITYRPILGDFDATGGMNPILDDLRFVPYTATQVMEGQERARQAWHLLQEKADEILVDWVLRWLVIHSDLQHTYWGA